MCRRAAPEVRDIIEKGVAEAVTFPWGSIAAVRHRQGHQVSHGGAALRDRRFVWVMNKAKYEQMSAAQKKVIDDHCTTEWAGKFGEPVGRLRARRHREAQGRARPRGLSDLDRRAARRVEEVGRAAGHRLGRQRQEGRRRSRCHHEGASRRRWRSTSRRTDAGALIGACDARRRRASSPPLPHREAVFGAAVELDGDDACSATTWIASSTRSSGSRRSSSASSPPTSSSRSCCATSSASRSPTATTSASCCSAS